MNDVRSLIGQPVYLLEAQPEIGALSPAPKAVFVIVPGTVEALAPYSALLDHSPTF